jgi:hypothetical protein
MILMMSIYLLAGILIADNTGHLLMENKSYRGILHRAAVIIFWPFIVGVIYIDIVDQVKKNRGV